MAESKHELARAKEYQRIRQVLTLVHLILTPAVLLVSLFTPLSFLLKEWALALTENLFAVVALYFLFFSGFMLVFDFPLALYSGFLLEHRFGLSNQTFPAWFVDFTKKCLISFLLSMALVEGLYALIWSFPEHWWLWAWAGYAAVSYILGKLFPVLIVPLFYKYGKVENERLKKRILDLASRYGLPVENVYSLNLSKTTKKANAAFMGLGRTKRVVLSDTLMDHFSSDEIETVVAHELGHFKHHDIWKQLALGMATSFAAFWIVFRTVEPLAESLGFDGAGDIASLPLLFLIFYLFYLLLMPLQNAFSRYAERAADLFALKAFPKREVFISCMEKLGRVNLADPEPNPLFEWFFYDHPAISKRIRMAREITLALVFLFWTPLLPPSLAEEKKSAAAEALEKKQKVELLSFFLKDPSQAQLPQTPMAAAFYNQAMEHFQKNEYTLARQALKDSIELEAQNPLAYELLGDIDYYQQKLNEAKANYEIAYGLLPSEGLKEKIEKTRKETKVERSLATYKEKHFIIKYHNEERQLEGFELRELLRKAYGDLSRDFAFYFDHQVVVLLYDEEEFKKISNAPHWAGGLYDGKVRMPVSRRGFDELELKALTTHEVTHAFVAAMGGRGAPAWISEGLAEFEENKVKEANTNFFEAALRQGTLIPIDQFMGQGSTSTISDPSQVSLFYQQSFKFVSYMVGRYGMFRIKQVLGEFAKGKDSEEALRAVLHISPERLEKEWKESLSK